MYEFTKLLSIDKWVTSGVLNPGLKVLGSPPSDWLNTTDPGDQKLVEQGWLENKEV